MNRTWTVGLVGKDFTDYATATDMILHNVTYMIHYRYRILQRAAFKIARIIANSGLVGRPTPLSHKS